MPDPDFPSDAGVNERVDAVMAILGDEDEGGGTSATPESADGTTPAGDAAPGDAPASGETTTQEADPVEPGASSAIEPPASFTPQLKEALSKLDPETQRQFAQWESERQKGVNQKLQESAELRRSLEAERAQLHPERQRLAQQLDAAITLTQNFDPVLAKGLRMTPADWSKLAADDPSAYVQVKADFDGRMASLKQAVEQKQQIDQQARSEAVKREHSLLVEAVPELGDSAKAKAFATELSTTLQAYGFRHEEIASVVDHRMIKVVRDAMLYRAGETQRQAAAKKQATPVPTVVKPGKGNADPGATRNVALLNRARNATSAHDQADAIAALLGD